VAALAPIGSCFTLNADGEARLTLVVSRECAKPLSDVMASGQLLDQSFVVQLQLPVKPDSGSKK
jgi:hypothetical protein